MIGENAVRTSARFIWLAAELRACRTTSVVIGSGSLSFEMIRSLVERLPNANYVSIADTAHFPSFEQPELFNRSALEFLDRTWGASAT